MSEWSENSSTRNPSRETWQEYEMRVSASLTDAWGEIERSDRDIKDLRAQVARLEAQIEQESAIDVARLEAIGRMGTQLQQLQSIRPFVRAMLAINRRPYSKLADLLRAIGGAIGALPDDVREWAQEGE